MLALGCGGEADLSSTATPRNTIASGAQPAGPNPPPSAPNGSAPFDNSPQPPGGATLIDKIEDRTPWEHCTKCAAHPQDKTPPLAVWEFNQFQNTPSMDGSSARFFVGGSAPYANALHWTKFGDFSWAKNFIWEFYIYASPESLKAQNLEFDLFQGHKGREFMFGTQCNYDKGVWQGWNGGTIEWVDFPQAPCKKFEPGKWTRVKWQLRRTDDGKIHYVSVTVGSTTHKVDRYQDSIANAGWADSLGIQMQQDLNFNADDYAIWVDNIRVWAW